RRLGVARVATLRQQRQPHHAVERARIEEMVVVVPRQGARQRALARRRRSVDRDDHATGSMRQPMPFMSARKSGKLVAIMAPSSTATPWRAARPITRNAMAMRWSRWVATVPPP